MSAELATIRSQIAEKTAELQEHSAEIRSAREDANVARKHGWMMDLSRAEDRLKLGKARLSQLKIQIGDLKRAERRLLDEHAAQEAATHAAVHAEAARLRQDDWAFWFRRFNTSLAIVNAAAFFAIVSGVLQADNLQPAAALAAPLLWPFMVGLVTAGATPVILAIRAVATSHKVALLLMAVAGTLAGTASGALIGGLISSIRALERVGSATQAPTTPTNAPVMPPALQNPRQLTPQERRPGL